MAWLCVLARPKYFSQQPTLLPGTREPQISLTSSDNNIWLFNNRNYKENENKRHKRVLDSHKWCHWVKVAVLYCTVLYCTVLCCSEKTPNCDCANVSLRLLGCDFTVHLYIHNKEMFRSLKFALNVCQ